MEFIMDAQVTRDNLKSLATFILGQQKPETREKDQERFQLELNQYKKKLIRAIQCLTLAIIKVEDGEF